MGLRDKYSKKDSSPKFEPMELNDMNVNAIYNRCVKKNENGEEIWDDQNLKLNQANIRYLLGQLEVVHQDVLQPRLDSTFLKCYTGRNWTSNPAQVNRLIMMGKACIELFVIEIGGKSAISFVSLDHTLSPKDPAFADWYEGFDGIRIQAEAAREIGALAECFALYEKGAERGFAIAQFVCAQMYHKGTGTKIDIDKALYWYEKAAGQGEAEAQYFCGEMYFMGDGTAVDKVKALYWFEKAAGQGNAKAQCFCGEMYYKGDGTAVDKAKALYWFEKAGEQEDLPPLRKSQIPFNCGLMHYKGEGTSVDKTKALYWFKKAAEQGHVEAKEIVEKIFLSASDEKN